MQAAWQALVEFATAHGYLSLAALAVIDGAGAPIPAEVVILALHLLVRHGDVALWPAVLVAAAANAAGTLVPYALGRWGGGRIADRLVPADPGRRQRLQAAIASYGPLVLVLARFTGFFRLAAVVVAGSLRLPPATALAAVFTGAAMWLVAGNALVHAASRWALLREGAERRGLDLLAVLVLLVLAGAATIVIRRRHNPPGVGRSGPDRDPGGGG